MISDRRCASRGTAALELALLMPFLAFTMVITVDFARLFYVKLALVGCARNGALYSCVPNQSAAFTSLSQAALADAANLSPAPTISSTTGADSDGNAYVEVTATATFTTVTSFPGVPHTLQLSETVRMRVSS
jgi:Flp pilus assembly protein TadG